MNPIFAAAREIQEFCRARSWRFCGAGRQRDWLDIEGIVTRQGRRLDEALIWRELLPLLELKGDSETEGRLRPLLCSGRQGDPMAE